MKAIYTEDTSQVTESPRVICVGTERECRAAAAKALGGSSLRGRRIYPTERGVAYCSGDSVVEIQ